MNKNALQTMIHCKCFRKNNKKRSLPFCKQLCTDVNCELRGEKGLKMSRCSNVTSDQRRSSVPPWLEAIYIITLPTWIDNKETLLISVEPVTRSSFLLKKHIYNYRKNCVWCIHKLKHITLHLRHVNFAIIQSYAQHFHHEPCYYTNC